MNKNDWSAADDKDESIRIDKRKRKKDNLILFISCIFIKLENLHFKSKYVKVTLESSDDK